MQDFDAIAIAGNATEADQIIECTVSGKDGNTKKVVSICFNVSCSSIMPLAMLI